MKASKTILFSAVVGLLALVFPFSAMAALSITSHSVDENQLSVTGSDLDLGRYVKLALVKNGKPVTMRYFRPGCECGVNNGGATIVWSENGVTITDGAIGGAYIKSALFSTYPERGATRVVNYNYKFTPYLLINSGVIAVPANLTLPTVSGDLNPGEALSVNNGTWSNSPTSYAYSWLIDGNDFGGIYSNSTFTLTNDHIGKMISVRVWAINTGGISMPVTSPTVGPIVAPALAPANTTPPTISGDEEVGSLLTVDAGTWSGTAPLAYSYQWQRCDVNGVNCANISGATTSSYTLVESDEGSTVRVVVTATNSQGSDSATAAVTGEIAAATVPPAGDMVHRSTLGENDPEFLNATERPTVPLYTTLSGYPVEGWWGQVYCNSSDTESYSGLPTETFIRYYDLISGDDITGWLPYYEGIDLNGSHALAGKTVGCRSYATGPGGDSPVYSSPMGIPIYSDENGDPVEMRPQLEAAYLNPVSGYYPIVVGEGLECGAAMMYNGNDTVTTEYRFLSYPGNVTLQDWSSTNTYTALTAGYYYCDARSSTPGGTSDPIQIQGVTQVLSGEPVISAVSFNVWPTAHPGNMSYCSISADIYGTTHLFEILDQDNNLIYAESKTYDDNDYETIQLEYILQVSDAGKTLKCRVTATNNVGTDSVVSQDTILALAPHTYDMEWSQIEGNNSGIIGMTQQGSLYFVRGAGTGDSGVINGPGSALEGKTITDFNSGLVVAEGLLYVVADEWSDPSTYNLSNDLNVPANLIGVSGNCVYSAVEVACRQWSGDFESVNLSLSGGEEIVGLDSAGIQGTCFYTTLNNVYCWGSNYYYNGESESASGEATPQLQPVGSLSGKTIRGIAVTALDLLTWCAIDTNDDAHCAGNNMSGIRNLATFNPAGYYPQFIADYNPVPVINDIGKVSTMSGTMMSYVGMCAIDLNGKLKCRGGSQYGETGGLFDCDGAETESGESMAHSLDSASCYQTQNATIIAYEQGAFLTSDGQLWVMGYGTLGIENSPFQDRMVPDPIA